MPSLIVLHYTAMDSVAAAFARLCDPAAEVSSHFLISAEGEIIQMVCETQRAWHAGAGAWAGAGDVNSRSIGIELDNRGDHPFAAPQMTALEGLIDRLRARWPIPLSGVIGHSDMASGRKFDPGPRFDWRRLARGGRAIWPDPDLGALPRPDPAQFLRALARFGYPRTDEEGSLALLLGVFRDRFRPGATGPLSPLDMAMALGLPTLRRDI